MAYACACRRAGEQESRRAGEQESRESRESRERRKIGGKERHKETIAPRKRVSCNVYPFFLVRQFFRQTHPERFSSTRAVGMVGKCSEGKKGSLESVA
jgi:hypothetical protein